MAARAVYVGVLLMTVQTPGVHSLKEKRGLVMPVTERLKVRFPVSVARLDGLDAHDWERIGVSAISADRVWLERTLASVRAFVEGRGLSVREVALDIEVWDGA